MELAKPNELTAEELILRDKFASAALSAIVQNENQLEAVQLISDACEITMQEATALSAYTYADAMLKVRHADYKTPTIKF